MATRVITSPGVQINELDLSLHVGTPAETKVLVMGYAPKGPTEELINITSQDDLEQVYGTPTTAAERYFYHSVKTLVNDSNAAVTAVRLPYGAGLGEGYANSYTALIYPLRPEASFTTVTNVTATSASNGVTVTDTNSVTATKPAFYTSAEERALYFNPNDYDTLADVAGAKLSTTTAKTDYVTINEVTNAGVTTLTLTYTLSTTETFAVNYYDASTNITVLAPVNILISDTEFESYSTGALNWATEWDFEHDPYSNTSFEDLLLNVGGLVVVNTDKSAVDEDQAGYYIGVSDNTDSNPATLYESITGIEAGVYVEEELNRVHYALVNPLRLNFKTVSQLHLPGTSSISEDIMASVTGYDFGSVSYNDCLVLGAFKLKSSLYGSDTRLLSYQMVGSYVGSLNNYRTQNSPYGGLPVTFALDTIVNSTSNRLKVQVLPSLSHCVNWSDSAGFPKRSVRVHPGARNLYSQGVVSKPYNPLDKNIGWTPDKIGRVFNIIDNIDYDIDVTIEAGLGTIYTHAEIKNDELYGGAGELIYDENYFVDLSGIQLATGEITEEGQAIVDLYNSVGGLFVEFATLNRKDHMTVLDPLRSIFVQGPNFKTCASKSFSFSRQVYWALKNIYGRGSNVSSYAAVYGNWLKIAMSSAKEHVTWVPASGWVAATISNSTEQEHPWSAPAGFNRAILFGVLDIASTPTQKQRDLLYKINVNPIAWFPGDGYVIWGQKTLYNKPSAFDRINVRRLFLVLEKLTKQVLKYFVFEPNTVTTRTRVVQVLKPLFELAKNTDGVYDYRIICDERNNTPLVIDNNEMKVSIYLQPVRTAEFILAEFIATRTGVNLDEITVV